MAHGPKDIRIIIAGAGIGGLTAALSLNQAGMKPRVYESTAEIKPLGVGLNLLPHASRELIELGLEEAVDEFAIQTAAMNYYTRKGKLVISQACGRKAGYRWPQWSVHRGELQMLLLKTFRDRAGADSVVTGAALVGFEETPAGDLRVQFQRPDGQTWSEQCDLLVGADGLHSATRKQLYPHEGKPVYSGMVVYRGAVEAPQYLDGQTMVIIGDKRLRMVSYPLSARLKRRGENRSLVNWIAALPMEEDSAPTEDWTGLSEQERLIPMYADWQFDWINVPAIMKSTREIFEFPVYDRDPLAQWTHGRVTLLGDAAHPLIPVSSNGAVQAIIDGRALAYALARHPDPSDGLRAYEEDRLDKANRVVRASRENGPDEVLEIARKRFPEDAENIDDYVPRAELQAVIDEFKEAAGFGVETLNARPSYNLDWPKKVGRP